MNLSSIPILSIVTYIPLVGALLIVFLVPKEKTGTIKALATAFAAIDFVVSMPLWWAFERGRDGYQFVEKASWIPSLGVSYHFGHLSIGLDLAAQVDGASSLAGDFDGTNQRAFDRSGNILPLLGIGLRAGYSQWSSEKRP